MNTIYAVITGISVLVAGFSTGFLLGKRKRNKTELSDDEKTAIRQVLNILTYDGKAQ